MTYAIFYEDTYTYLTEANNVLFSTDSTHNDLFQYVAKDISSLSELFEQYIDSKLDTKTFEPRSSIDKTEIISAIIESMKSLHPYYRHEYKKVIVKAIGKYFNELLIYATYVQKTLNPETPLKREWYYNMFSTLMPSFIQESNGFYPDGLYPDDFFTKYRNLIDVKDFDTREIEETFLTLPPKTPSVFSEEIETHKIVCRMLYFILDASADSLNNLSPSQRIWFFGNLYTPYNWEQTHISKHLSYIPSIIYKANLDYSQEVEYKTNIYDIFEQIYKLDNLDKNYENISSLIPEPFNSAIEYAKEYGGSALYEKYDINSLRELLLQEIICMAKSNIKIKKCKNCNKYFVINRSTQKYCHRLFENSEKTCSQIGRRLIYQEKKRKNPTLILYDKIYQKHRSYIRKDIPSTMAKFNSWSMEASDKRQKYIDGDLSKEEFEKWLLK